MRSVVWVVVILGMSAFLLAAVLALGSLVPNRASPTAAPAADPREAWRICQEHVRAGLKAPSTADFPAYDPDAVTSSGAAVAVYRVESYVDADNSFGAHIRTRYACTVQWTGTAWDFQGLDLQQP